MVKQSGVKLPFAKYFNTGAIMTLLKQTILALTIALAVPAVQAMTKIETQSQVKKKKAPAQAKKSQKSKKKQPGAVQKKKKPVTSVKKKSKIR